MKQILLLAALCTAFVACKETPKSSTTSTSATTTTTTKAAAAKDTLIGMAGCQKASMTGENAYTYPEAKVTVKSNSDSVGETINVNGTDIKNEDAYSFYGVYNNFLFIDNGSGPNGSELLVYGIKEKKMLFRTHYEGELTLNKDKINYIMPMYATKAKFSKVNCPEKAKWEKDGLSIGYGLPMQYDLTTLTPSETGSVTCFPMQ
jgi:hypothetical protein